VATASSELMSARSGMNGSETKSVIAACIIHSKFAISPSPPFPILFYELSPVHSNQCGLEMIVCPEDRHEKICPRHGQVDKWTGTSMQASTFAVEHVKSGSQPSGVNRFWGLFVS
jgi:hypothetical protein